MVAPARIDPGPSLAEIVFKAASVGVLVWIASGMVLGVAGAIVVRFVGDPTGEGEVFIIMLAFVLAKLVAVAAVVFSAAQDFAARRRGRARRSMPG